MESGVERSVSTKAKAVFEVGEADEHERQQGFEVPLVIEQYMEMIEGILMKQVCLVDEEDRTHALLGEVLDVRVDGQKQVPCRVGLGQTESQAKVAVEVAPTDGAVLAVDQAEVGRGERMAKGAQHACLSDPRLAGEQGAGAGVHGVGEVFDQGEFRRGEPESASPMSLENGSAARPKCER